MVADLPIGVSVNTAVTALPFVIMRAVLKLDIRTARLPRSVKHIVTDITIVCLFELRIDYFHVMFGRQYHNFGISGASDSSQGL